MTTSRSRHGALARGEGSGVRRRAAAGAAVRARRAHVAPARHDERKPQPVGAPVQAPADVTATLLGSWECALAAAERALLAAAAESAISATELRSLQRGVQEERRWLHAFVGNSTSVASIRKRPQLESRSSRMAGSAPERRLCLQ